MSGTPARSVTVLGAGVSEAGASVHPMPPGSPTAGTSVAIRRGVDRVVYLFAGLSVLRLVMTANHDILFLNQPYDDFWFVHAAHRWIWGMQYDQLAFAQLQIYAIWLKCMTVVGLPQRLAIDLLWLVGSSYLGLATGRLCRKRWPAMTLFVFLAFHPYSITLFDRTLSENLATCLCTIALAAMLDVWTFRENGPDSSPRRQVASGIVASFAFALAWHARKESIVLLVPLAPIVIASLIHPNRWWRAAHRRLAGGILVGPLMAVVAVGVVLASANYLRWGVFARYELAAPGYLRALRALNAIDPGAPTPRWVTVTAATRAKAYAASPTFAELRPFLEGSLTDRALALTERYSGVRGEIGNGWFYWVIRDMASEAGWHLGALGAEAKYNAVADEIQTAFRQGKLARRPAPFAFIDPDWRKWLPLLPHAVMIELGEVITPAPRDLAMPPEDADKAQQTIFLATVGRRRPLEHADARGRIIAPAGTVIGLGTSGLNETSMVLSGPPRADLNGAYAFALSAPTTTPPNAVLHVEVPGGTTADLSFGALKVGASYSLDLLPGALVSIDRLGSTPPRPRADRMLPALCAVWSALGCVMAAAGMAAMVVIGRDESQTQSVARLVLIAVLAGIVARAFLLGVLDSSSWNGVQARYALPAVPLFAVFGIVGFWKIAKRFESTALEQHHRKPQQT